MMQSALINLLEESFPGIKANIKRCNDIGYSWESLSKPFVKGDFFSHVGLINFPFFADGHLIKACALHAICTTQSQRGQGLASELIQEALLWAEKQFDVVLLFTEIPKFYEQFSFKHIQESRFCLKLDKKIPSRNLRQLVSPHDDALLRRLFRVRAPLSNRLHIEDYASIATFNALFATHPLYWSLHYSQDLDAIIAYHQEGTLLHLFDVIAETMPSLEDILNVIPSTETLYFYFSPDRFTHSARPEACLYDKGHLMVRGPWPQSQPFMISPLSRC